jgi:polyisoprenoid-binding protein YceI
MRRKTLITSVILILMAGTSFAAGTYTIDSVHSNVAFKVRHLVSRTGGQFTDFSGTITADFENLAGSGVELVIKTASIDTKDEGRDKHLRSEDFFDVEKFPEITFSSSKITKVDDTSFAVVGELNMHGVSRQITLTVTYLGEATDPWGGTRAGYQLSTTLNRKDYGISWNKALDNGGLILGDEVEISIDLEVVKKKE